MGDASCNPSPRSCPRCRARAIKYRQENQEAVGGFFSQIGELYVVHHLWGKRAASRPPRHRRTNPGCALRAPKAPEFVGPWRIRGTSLPLPAAYKDLQSREETRNAAWRKRGWDENVYYTGERVGRGGALCSPRHAVIPIPPACRDPIPLFLFCSATDPHDGVTDHDPAEDLPAAVTGPSPGGGRVGPSPCAPIPGPIRVLRGPARRWGSPRVHRGAGEGLRRRGSCC